MNKSVLACKAGDWHLQVWNPADTEPEPLHLEWCCRSWRHEGDCRRWKGAQDFARVSEAMRTRSHWSYVVLTFAQRDWPNKWELYKQGVFMWAKMRKRIVRRFGTMQYVQTWERHKKGGAHVNVVIANRNLYDEISTDFRAIRNGWLEPNAVACGFGMRTWIEPIAGTDGMAGYLTKLSRELTGQGGKDQVPEDAPRHFRRIRASRKTLPPVAHSEYTGRMVFCPLEKWLENSRQSMGVIGAMAKSGVIPEGRLSAADREFSLANVR